MKVLIYNRYKGGKARIFAERKTLSEGKKELSTLYMTAIENFPDEITENDHLSNDGKELTLFNSTYWIERNQQL